MLPARGDMVIVVIVTTAQMVLPRHVMVMIDRTALILRVEIFEDDIAQPRTILQVQFTAKHNILEIVEHIAMFLLLIPLTARAVSVVIELQH